MKSEEVSQKILDRVVAFGITITGPQLAALACYYQVLQQWNRRVNLTAMPLDDCAEPTLDRLIVEPLLASRLIRDEPMGWFDLGSGGGSPAIPLKIVRPSLRLTMVEGRERKAAFLRETARQLVLDQVRVLTTRIERISNDEADSCDIVTSRGVRLDATLIAKIAWLLKKNGQLLAFGWETAAPSGSFTVADRIGLPGGSDAVLLARSSGLRRFS